MPSSTSSILVIRPNVPEPARRYEPGGYHPVNVGEIYNQRYQVVRQLGWGQYSTVWLVQDTRDGRPAAMKVLVGKLTNDKSGWDEVGILKTILSVQGPNGAHICLITEPMGPTVLYIYECVSRAMPLSLVKRISKHVLHALQYIHEECGLVHTGDNIFMTTPSAMESASVELHEDDFVSTIFKLADFGAANKISNRYAAIIQPEALRAPEVIIGAEWDTTADIWNFGCLMYEFARGAKLFDPSWDCEVSGMNSAQTHLAQMVGLLGEIPSTLLEKGKRSELYFDAQGRLLRSGAYFITLEELLQRTDHHSPEDVSLTADFLSQALRIDPQKRWSASQLLQHRWLSNTDQRTNKTSPSTIMDSITSTLADAGDSRLLCPTEFAAIFPKQIISHMRPNQTAKAGLINARTIRRIKEL
ncbi:hypothetical protein SERLA73DRAFT_77409 [Serpula lacrymans var. lacrymans S7.3]|uniref:non-specific serine/threonine protein kinase n=2 Tax=Serpula lacrymans var. lacrymans TaxID=341189 RepID=F8QA66_SERL3|nr:uncharacterized protein SERLADRAFT_442286 [Serpula lacrymans var. lacrymans S7.9]EGN94656.1 hypothetical protein SERLA73DRAFT_77409 [Serpula lacrymans var. lacrymans S7.3]EGO20137.1 hypothetical protein SERLADRAFT_442286 [Serpula lacrymans var. lacrymans S7.9]